MPLPFFNGDLGRPMLANDLPELNGTTMREGEVLLRQRSRTRVVLTMAPIMAMVTACGPSKPSNEPETLVQAEPPPAEAPPDPGAMLPEMRLPPGREKPLAVEDRPQGQLVEWSESMSEELNIPRAALQAYGYAARMSEVTAPECGLSWPVLAGIGEVESSHGRYGGAELDETARPSIPIRGLALDGQDGVKRIEDTDGGALDGDTRFDRAIGPLQFIPGTWRKWATDADGDGVADPHDLDDAALAAANYLCAGGGDLQDPERFWAAVLDYNASHEYVQDVLDYADQYGKASRQLSAPEPQSRP